MQSCSLFWVLLFLTLTFTTPPTLATSVSVKLHQTATLPCKRDCPGVVKWTMFQKNFREVLAQCDQTSCRSQEGYEMSHDQYLKGDFPLIIPAADYTKRNMYTCECNDRDIDDVRLIIETLLSSVELNPSEDLVMGLPIPNSVELIYKPKQSVVLYGERICTVTEHTLQCKAEYTHRASLSSTNIILRHVQLNDSGSYTIQDMENKEVIHIYTLFVKEVQVVLDGQQTSQQLLKWLLPVLLLTVVCIIGTVCFLKIWRTKHKERIRQEVQLRREKQQQELQLEREKQQQELQLQQARNLNYQKFLEKFEQWLEENKHLHTKESMQKRTYSDTDVAQITDKKHFCFIEEYRLKKSPQRKKMQMVNKSTQHRIRSISDDPEVRSLFLKRNQLDKQRLQDKAGSIQEHVSETELDTSQQGACSNADEVELTTQMEEMSPLVQTSWSINSELTKLNN